MADEAKAKGNAAFSAGNYADAVRHFTDAIALSPDNHVLYSNRSAAHASLNQYAEALSDAQRTVQLKPDWPRATPASAPPTSASATMTTPFPPTRRASTSTPPTTPSCPASGTPGRPPRPRRSVTSSPGPRCGPSSPPIRVRISKIRRGDGDGGGGAGGGCGPAHAWQRPL